MARTKAHRADRKTLLKRAEMAESDISAFFEEMSLPVENSGIINYLRENNPELAEKYDEGDWTDDPELQDQFKANKQLNTEFEMHLGALTDLIAGLESSADPLAKPEAAKVIAELNETDKFKARLVELKEMRKKVLSDLALSDDTDGTGAHHPDGTPKTQTEFINELWEREQVRRFEADVEAETQQRAEHLKQEIEKLRDNDDGLSLNVIAERAGVSKSTLYDLLSDKTKNKNLRSGTERKLTNTFSTIEGWDRGRYEDEIEKRAEEIFRKNTAGFQQDLADWIPIERVMSPDGELRSPPQSQKGLSFRAPRNFLPPDLEYLGHGWAHYFGAVVRLTDHPGSKILDYEMVTGTHGPLNTDNSMFWIALVEEEAITRRHLLNNLQTDLEQAYEDDGSIVLAEASDGAMRIGTLHIETRGTGSTDEHGEPIDIAAATDFYLVTMPTPVGQEMVLELGRIKGVFWPDTDAGARIETVWRVASLIPANSGPIEVPESRASRVHPDLLEPPRPKFNLDDD